MAVPLVASPISRLVELGQSAWYDNIRRALLTSGEFARMVHEDGLSGVTSNPSIFEKAIVGSSDYDDAIAVARRASAASAKAPDVKAVYEGLAIDDLREAADILRPVYDRTEAGDGYVSMEVAPDLAHDTAGTIAEARRLWTAVDRPNLMIKVPGTDEGIPAIRELTADGINVNITLLFSRTVYERVVDAYLSGLEQRLAAGEELGRIASVASFFVSRIDSKIDPQVSPALQGKVAIANAKLTYARFGELFADERWEQLRAHGAREQRLLWASTSTKNPAYSDVLYVESLIGPDTVDTIYPATYEAFKAHGRPRVTLTEDLGEARATIEALPGEGVDLEQVTTELVEEGVQKFLDAQRKLLASVEESLLAPEEPATRLPTRALPAALAERVDSIVEEWRDHDKVRRLWEHDATLWTGDGEADWLGWLAVALDQLAHDHRFTALVEDVRAQGFEQAVVLGMGGSSLAPDVLAHSFPPAKGLPRLHVLDSTDPQQIASLERKLDLAKTLFFVSSKSGTTLEPNIFGAYFHARVSDLLGAEEAGRRFVAITDRGTPLEEHARRSGFREVFHGWSSIGGRYSALSDFGMIPGAATGVDVLELLDRAERMAHACAASVPADENPGLALGAILGACATNGRDKVTLVCSSGVHDLGAWLEQLLAESTGKHGKGIVPVDREPLGAPDAYGDDRLFVSLRLAADPAGEDDDKLTALEQAGQPVVRIVLDDLYDLGGEFFRWEFATAVAGAVIGIDPFDQPDVEEAKIATRKLTESYEQAGSLPELEPLHVEQPFTLYADERNARELRSALGGDASFERYLAAHLRRAGTGDYAALLAYLPMTLDHEQLLTEIRVLVRDRLRIATCVGFGPRFQHSTGQAYKGGPNTGVFLQLTCRDGVDLLVPGHGYTFGVVKEAQARGDFDTLAARERRALRVDLGDDPTVGLVVLRDAVDQALA